MCMAYMQRHASAERIRSFIAAHACAHYIHCQLCTYIENLRNEVAIYPRESTGTCRCVNEISTCVYIHVLATDLLHVTHQGGSNTFV